ncbi:MAG: recombinase family protein [Oscillospiraceae bacterium]|jgi:site-specific DNA recombinase|nr:recombinase family protein [Oscillospiraceae bacterium]
MRIRVIKPHAATTGQRKKVCGYVRVSTDSEEQENSLDNQTQYYTDYINANPEWEFVGVYADRGISGFKENRPEFQRMLANARAGEIDLIVVKSISRFARNTETTLDATRELKRLGVGVFFELQNINTLTTSGELLMTIQGAFAQAESEGASQVGKMVYQRKFSRGIRSHGSDRTYGFAVDADGELCINEDEARKVRQIFNLAEQGVWPSKIKAQLNMEGTPSPGGKCWNDTGIARVLRNVMYKGDIILQKTCKDRLRRSRPNHGQADQWYIADNHPFIVPPDQWERVQAVLADRRKQLDTPLPPAPIERCSCKTQYPLTNMLYCPYCGEKLIHKWSNGTREYWACKTNLKVSSKACKGVWLPAAVAGSWGVTEPVTVVPYKDEHGMNHFTAYPKAEYDASADCPYRKDE